MQIKQLYGQWMADIASPYRHFVLDDATPITAEHVNLTQYTAACGDSAVRAYCDDLKMRPPCSDCLDIHPAARRHYIHRVAESELAMSRARDL